MKEKKQYQQIVLKEIIKIYTLLCKWENINFLPTKKSKFKLESMLSSINDKHFGVYIYETTEEKVVAHFWFIIKNHPFIDGNKRCASLILLYLSYINQISFNKKEVSYSTIYILSEWIAKSKTDNHQKIIKLLVNIFFKK